MEAMNVAARDLVDAAQSAQRFDKRSERPASNHRRDPLDQGISSLLCSPHRLEIILKDNAMGMLVKGLARQPTAMTLCPVLAGRIATAMSKQECEQLLARTHQVHRCIHSGSDQVAKRFVRGVRNPDWR